MGYVKRKLPLVDLERYPNSLRRGLVPKGLPHDSGIIEIEVERLRVDVNTHVVLQSVAPYSTLTEVSGVMAPLAFMPPSTCKSPFMKIPRVLTAM